MPLWIALVATVLAAPPPTATAPKAPTAKAPCLERLDGLMCPHGKAPATPELVPVPTAARDLPAGHVLAADDLVWVGLPKDYVVKDTLGEHVLGRKLIDPIVRDDVLRGERLAPDESAAPLPAPVAELVCDVPTPRPDVPSAPADLTVMVIIAGRELAPGAVIAEADLYAVGIQPRYLPDRVYLSPEHVVGRTVATRILRNEFIRAPRLVE